MVKRTLAGVLWFAAIAYGWNFIASVLGVSEAPGYLLGIVGAMLVAGDPLHRIWSPVAAGAPAHEMAAGAQA
ncbi:MAG TPA: hypothetical protein VFL03_01290 [Candidatus Limnocylindrales bacterium]|jgi:hypothetical protein|nr:hypothetical protein [Candidatus Limnocylindrales bacterium]